MNTRYIYAQHTSSYFALRKAVGWIGILLPFVLMLGNFLYFDGELILPTISDYYHSPMRDYFVGALIAMAIFLLFYSGIGKWDRITGVAAGVLAIGVVFFPTPIGDSADLTGKLHGVFAGSLFILLALISIFRFPRKRDGGAIQFSDKLQIACGIIMLGCVLAAFGYFYARGFAKSDGSFVFISESIALIAFGISWYTEGLDLKKELG